MATPVFPPIPPGHPIPKCFGRTGGIYTSPTGVAKYIPPCAPNQPVDKQGFPVGPPTQPTPPPGGGGGGNGGGGGGGGGTGGGGGGDGGGGLCPCPGGGLGGGGGGGGGGGAGGGPPGSDPTTPINVCRDHSGNLRNLDSGGTLDLSSCLWVTWTGLPNPIQCCDVNCASDIPYCDEQPCPTPPPPECDPCLAAANQGIVDALNHLADKLGGHIGDGCSYLDSCLDYLVDKLKDRILPPAKTCDQCCKRIELGLATAVECAAVDANCTCQQCKDYCSSDNEGECCSTCGQKDCICKDGQCIPKPTEGKFNGWCNVDSGDVTSLPSDAPPLDPPWQVVPDGPFDTSDAADKAAQDYCQQSPQPPAPEEVPPVKPGLAATVSICSLEMYATRGAAEGVLESMQPPVYSDTLIGESIKAARKLNDEVEDIPLVGQLLGPLFATAVSPAVFSDIAADILCGAVGCSAGGVKQAIQTLIAVGIAEQITGVDIPQLKLPVEYAINAAVRPRVISAEDALGAYLADGVSEDDAKGAFGAAGYDECVFDAKLQAERSKPNPIELRNMVNRKIIEGQDYLDGMRQLGYIDQQTVNDLYNSMEVRPSLAEIIHMMIRDADNKKVQETFNFDERFEDKFGETLQRWTDDQQIPVEVTKMAYRSHWDIPSKQELFEFWRRLRNTPEFGPPEKLDKEIDAALTHLNVLPHWFDYYRAIIYHPMSRIDIRRSYQIGAINDKQAKDALQQLGYSDDTIDLLHKFLVRLKQQAALKHEAIIEWTKGEIDGGEVESRMSDDGYEADQIRKAMDAASVRFADSDAAKAFIRGDLGREAFNDYLDSVGVSADGISSIMDNLAFIIRDRATEKQYVSGLITNQEAQSRMVDNGVAPSVASTILLNLDDAIAADAANRCKAAIRKKYLTGGLTQSEATEQLTGVGIVSEAADRIVSNWGCEKYTRDKHAGATTLCGWYSKGAITADDFIERMTNVGFTRNDSLMLLSDCSDRIATQQAKKQAKEAAEAEKSKRKAQQAADRAEAKANKILAALEKARAEKVRLRKQRQTQFLQIAKNVEKKSLAAPAEIVPAVIDVSNTLESRGFTLDEALRIMLQSSEALSSGTELQVYFDLVNQNSQVVSATESEVLSIPESNIPS